jgi:hypothetical protein
MRSQRCGASQRRGPLHFENRNPSTVITTPTVDKPVKQEQAQTDLLFRQKVSRHAQAGKNTTDCHIYI